MRGYSRLELLAVEAGVSPRWLRWHLRRRIQQELRRRWFGSPTAGLTIGNSGNGRNVAALAWDLAEGDGLLALSLVVDVLDRHAEAA